jgi:hypothetical protein
LGWFTGVFLWVSFGSPLYTSCVIRGATRFFHFLNKTSYYLLKEKEKEKKHDMMIANINKMMIITHFSLSRESNFRMCMNRYLCRKIRGGDDPFFAPLILSIAWYNKRLCQKLIVSF